ncbi:MAG: glycoside hydrolase family 5 protein, partial [Treponema sp.]|nr:glycoside hydrolase family 5 protein [Treponema sp.]
VGDLYHFKKAYASKSIVFQPPDWSYIADNMNANLVRIATHPNLWRNEKADVLAYLKTNVQNALAAGLFVIIDYHTIGFPDGQEEEEDYSDDFISYDTDFSLAKDFWDTVSAQFTDGRILFELWNEPVSKKEYKDYASKWNALKIKWEELIAIIRKNKNNNVVLAGGDDWTHELRGVKSNLIRDANTAYTWHYYANEGDNSKEVWEARLDGLYQHRPVVVTEWGFSSNPEDESYYAEPQAFADTFTQEIRKEKGLHHTAWGYDPFYTPNMLWHPDSFPDYSKLNDYGEYVADFLKSAETLVRP